jgi:O-antigen ligase
MFSSFLDPNFAGAFFVLYFLFLFGMTIDYIKHNKINYSLILSLISLISLVAILLTYSRSALIMLIVGSTTLFLLKKQKKLIFLILGVAVIFFVIAANNFYIESLNLLRTASSNARLESASHALVIIKDNPIIGVGFNAYRYAQVKYGFVKENNDGALSHSGAGTDNSFLFVLATTGVIGLIFYLYMWFKILKTQGNKTMGSIVIASIVGIFVNSFFINSLFYSSIMLWMWILIGISSSFDSKLKESKSP